MKKYIFAIISFILALISINTVYAATSNGWAYDIKRPVSADVYDCNNSKCDVSLQAKSTNIDDSTFYFYSNNSTSMSANGPGNMWTFLTDTPLSKDYLYSITTYVCQDTTNVNLTLKDYYSSGSLSNVYNKVDKGTSYFSQSLSNLGTNPFDVSQQLFMRCSYFTSIYKPSVNSKYIGVNFTTNLNANNFMTSFLGYKVDSLGLANNLSTSDIQNIIGSSGLASSSDINSLNTSITNIQNQLANNISSAENSINNNIDDAEANIVGEVADGVKSITDNLAEESQNIQNGIKDGFEECRDSYNMIDYSIFNSSIQSNDFYYVTFPGNKQIFNSQFKTNTQYTLSFYGYAQLGERERAGVFQFVYTDGTYSQISVNTTTSTFFSLTSVSGKTVDYIKLTWGIRPQSYLKDLMLNEGSSAKPYEKYGEKICKNRIDSTNDKLDDLNGTLNNSDSSGATDDAGSFFSGFTTNTFGLTSIITSPLNLINSLTSKTCSPLRLQIPFVNQNLDLPCMTTIYQQHFGTFLTIYQTITFGIISYWICIRIFALVKDFKNPDHDEIEVMDL